MAVTGKTGADAIYVALKHICHVLSKYNAKLVAVVAAALAAGAITAAESAAILAFIAAAQAACDAFAQLAAYSGF
jgi:hypothetical protein